MNKQIIIEALEMTAVLLGEGAQVNHPDRLKVLKAVLEAIKEIGEEKE